ncbi:UNVERIFIED_CONTAM: tungstate transport system ATP-binding protein [Brevibacillus sp. OAP136]
MTELRVSDLTVTYDHKTILDVPHASFECGRIYGIIGPSGSGKSTLLRVINLLTQPASGHLHFFGVDVHLPSLSHREGLSLQRQMGFVPQKPSMFHSSVFDNVAQGLRYRKLPRETIRIRVEDALEKVDLTHAANQMADTLSGGEMQRIALARAMVYEPVLLLLDEPTASLDPSNIAIFERVIQAIHAKNRTTILMVTHNLAQAKRLTHACLFIHKGRILEASDTEPFFHSPETQEVQDFMAGRMIY